MRRKSRAARQRELRNILWGTIALAIAIAIIGSAVYFFVKAGDQEIDAKTLCPIAGPNGHVVLLVDKTDPLNFMQRQAFLSYLSEFGRGKVGAGDLFSVYVIGEDFKTMPEPIFEMCNPGKGEDKNVWLSNPERIRKQYEERFIKPMMNLVDQLQASRPAETSPIMEMIQVVAINGFRKRNVLSSKRLFIVSDMLQNTESFSHYRGEIEFEKFKQTLYFHKIKTDLINVDVELAYLLNTPQRQTRRHLKFWEDYFHEIGARVVSVRMIEG